MLAIQYQCQVELKEYNKIYSKMLCKSKWYDYDENSSKTFKLHVTTFTKYKPSCRCWAVVYDDKLAIESVDLLLLYSGVLWTLEKENWLLNMEIRTSQSLKF